jgi:hypothetical protein
MQCAATNWNAIILEIMQEHGLPIHTEAEENKLRALFRESKLPVIPRSLQPMCTNFNRITKNYEK